MAVRAMVDEYYERYRRHPHEELYHLLMAGVPAQVNAVADRWHTAGDSVGSLGASLRADLDRLMPTWVGKGSREFRYRVGLIIAYAQKLADEAGALRSGLTVMSGSLAEAQRRAEADRPEAVRPQFDALLPALGHTLAEEERAKARERIAVLVARLSADYAVADHRSWPAMMPIEPGDLPAGASGTGPLLPVSVPVTDATVPAGLTTLAGAGIFHGAPPGATGVSPGSVPAAAPPTTLSGAGPALAGLSGHVIGQVNRGEGRSGATPAAAGGTAGGVAAGAGPVPLMGGAIGGRADGGYTVTDPRLADADNAWSRGEQLEWSGDTDAPPSILDG